MLFIESWIKLCLSENIINKLIINYNFKIIFSIFQVSPLPTEPSSSGNACCMAATLSWQNANSGLATVVFGAVLLHRRRNWQSWCWRMCTLPTCAESIWSQKVCPNLPTILEANRHCSWVNNAICGQSSEFFWVKNVIKQLSYLCKLKYLLHKY